MKECVWKACPHGGYYASKSDNPAQMMLIEPEPDLSPLRSWIRNQLTSHPKRWSELTESLRRELWLGKHLNECIRDMRKSGLLVAESFEGRFSQKSNPLLRLSEGATE